MKIGLLIDNLNRGGAQRQLVKLAHYLVQNHHHVTVYYYVDSGGYVKILKDIGCEICLMECKNRVKYLRLIWYLSKASNDVSISYLIVPSLINVLANSAVRRKKIKVVCSYRSSYMRIESSLKLRLQAKIILKYCDKFIVNSQENLNYFAARKNSDKLDIAWNQVDTIFCKISNPSIDIKLNLATFSSHRHLKNGLVLLKAISKLPQSILNQLRLDWYGSDTGDGSLDLLKAFVSERKLSRVVTFYEEVEDVAEKLKCYGGVVLPSLSEGFPNVLCEAAVAGRILLSSNICGIGEIFPHQNIFFFDPKSEASIKQVILEYTRINKSQFYSLSQRNREIGNSYFTKESELYKFIDVEG